MRTFGITLNGKEYVVNVREINKSSKVTTAVPINPTDKEADNDESKEATPTDTKSDDSTDEGSEVEEATDKVEDTEKNDKN